MLDPICTVKERNKQKLAAKTMVRFCRGDPVLVTGDINGDIDVYRLNRTNIIMKAIRSIFSSRTNETS